MASSPGNQKATHSENSQGKKSQHTEEAIFYMNCRAAYLTVLKSSLDNIKSKEQLSLGNDWIFSPLTLTWDDYSESIPVHKLSNWFKELRVVLDACWKWECQTGHQYEGSQSSLEWAIALAQKITTTGVP